MCFMKLIKIQKPLKITGYYAEHTIKLCIFANDNNKKHL